MSAAHLSLYGYPRHTTPNLERLSQRALVFHSHHAGGNFTTPGTASILTGTYPWTHRAVNLGSVVHQSVAKQNIFNLLSNDYYCAGFAQNILADLYLRQFANTLDLHMPLTSFVYERDKPVISQKFSRDPLMSYYVMDDFLLSTHQKSHLLPGSLSMGYMGLLYILLNKNSGEPTGQYPYGLPSNSIYYFENNIVYDGVREAILNLHKGRHPFFAYFHLMSPHSPYSPSSKYVDSLADMTFPTRKVHPLGDHHKSSELLAMRQHYDEYVANVDAEMGRLLDGLAQAGVLDDTYFFIMSDHGELFEYGVLGHVTPLLYEPIIHTPLLVFAPGQTQRTDILVPTSNVDILPTVLSLVGQPIPAGVEGRVLPGLGGEAYADRPVITVEAKEASSFQPLSPVSLSMIKGEKKLIYYKGYEKFPDTFELYDLQADNEERRNIYSQDTLTAGSMKAELLDLFAQADRPYQSKS